MGWVPLPGAQVSLRAKMKNDILYILIWLKKFSSTFTLSVIVRPPTFLSFMLSTQNNVSRCLAGSMGRGTGGKSGLSSPEGWWENLCKVPVSTSHLQSPSRICMAGPAGRRGEQWRGKSLSSPVTDKCSCASESPEARQPRWPGHCTPRDTGALALGSRPMSLPLNMCPWRFRPTAWWEATHQIGCPWITLLLSV